MVNFFYYLIFIFFAFFACGQVTDILSLCTRMQRDCKLREISLAIFLSSFVDNSLVSSLVFFRRCYRKAQLGVFYWILICFRCSNVCVFAKRCEMGALRSDAYDAYVV